MDDLENKELDFDDLNDSSTSYLTEINKIRKAIQPPEIKLDLLDILIKDFLRKRYHIKKSFEYSELIDYFLDKKKPHIATFCHEMVENLYGGNTLDNPSIALLLDDARLMVQKEFNTSKVNSEETTLHAIIKPIIKNDSKKSSATNEKNVSQQTRKIIDKYMSVEDSGYLTQKEDVVSDINKQQEDEMHMLKSKLSLSKNNPENQSSVLEVDDPGKIENIDDLARLKEKIRIKRISTDQK